MFRGIPIPVPQAVVFVPHPIRSLGGWNPPPDARLVPITVAVPDATLRGWVLPGEAAAPWVLYFYGNAGSARTARPMLRWIHEASGMTSVTLDYRGYEYSSGSPRFEKLRADAVLTFDAIAQRAGTAGVIVYGQSLGSTLATHVAALRPVRAVVLHSPIGTADGVFDVWRKRFLPLGLRWVLRPVPTPAIVAGMNNVEEIRGVRAPLFVLHGDRDQLVPFAGGRAVFEAAASPHKQFVRARNRHHADIALAGTAEGEALSAFLQSMQGPSFPFNRNDDAR